MDNLNVQFCNVYGRDKSLVLGKSKFTAGTDPG